MRTTYFLAVILLVLLASSCRDVAGPVEGNTPGGPFVVWFNGLSGNADAFFIASDSLITNAWSTGEAPNQIVDLGNGQFAVLSSLSADLRVFPCNTTGETERTIQFPAGSNPYSFCLAGDIGYSALSLADAIAVFSIQSAEITGMISTRSNPSGVSYIGGMLFVGHANFPDASSPGGVYVINPVSGEVIKWIDTGVNTHWLKLQPSGMIHCYSTTYKDDGKVTIINPETLEIAAVIHCGGAPGEGIRIDDSYISPDGWGNGGLVKYTETGDFTRVDLPFAATNLAVCGDTLYATSFGVAKVYMLNTATLSVVDSLQAGGEGPQGIIAVDPGD
jgi:hypothetical protein